MEITPELLKSLKRLAENPGATESEREVALQKFQQLAAKAGIDIDQLNADEEKVDFYYWYGSLKTYEIKLAHQILFMVTNAPTVKAGYVKRSPKRYVYYATYKQHVEFQMLFPYYLKVFRKSLHDYIAAFINANDLFSERSRDVDPDSISAEQLEKLFRIAKMAAGIKRSPTPHKQLSSGG